MDDLNQGLPLTLPLWPEAPPFGISAHPGLPRLTLYLPSAEHRTGLASIICPGGGYGSLAVAKEGHRIARFLSSFGHAAAVLEYRHGPDRHPAPLADAQRAIRVLRANAAAWHLNPGKIGILGFSAGGHLAGSAALLPPVDGGSFEDAVEQHPCRPDFAVLVYPVVSLTAACAHQGSRQNLLGDEAETDLAAELSLEQAVTASAPPMLLIHTDEDDAVPPENSTLLYHALRAHRVPAELHIYERGRHGIGLADNHPWGAACLNWLKNRL